MRVTNTGSLRGLPPTSARIALPGVDLDETGQITLPSRMTSWSWSLFYLYGL
jgi:hypothetical protein